MQELKSVELFTDLLEQGGIPYVITGAIASIIYGEPRLTNDLDLVLNIKSSDMDRFTQLFPLEQFYCPPKETILLEIRREARAHFNLIHHESGFKADCYLVGADPLQHWAFANKRMIQFPSGKNLPLAPPEYVILKKLEYYQEGKSEKHLRDIENMLKVSSEIIDPVFLKFEAQKRGVADFLIPLLPEKWR